MYLDPVPPETRDPRAYLWTVSRETFDRNCLPNPIKHPQTRINFRMFIMSKISLFQSLLLLVYKVHDPQAKTNGYLFYTKPSCAGSNRNLLTTDCYCETSNLIFFPSSPSSPAHIHMWITHTSTVDCKHWEFGSLLNKWTSIKILRKHFRHAL
jgi:hypothetical protein